MAEVEFIQVQKRYGSVQAVRPLDLRVEDGEFVVLLGPSGCGKTTLLRMVAGLESVTDGDLLIGGRRVNDIKSSDRNIAMVFQSYALYPHLTVKDNLGFPLRVRRTPPDLREQRVTEVAATVGLSDYLDRRPGQLSGGQRQRVAVGRAIVRQPEVFLFDEPLSNLDAKLRDEMRGELIRLHSRLGKTTLYVTHDQTEAMTMAHRVVIMRGGEVQQVGSPQEVFSYPANVFVAGFVGSPSMNFIHGELASEERGWRLDLGLASTGLVLEANSPTVGPVAVGFRPYDVSLITRGQKIGEGLSIPVNVLSVQPLGHEVILEIVSPDGKWKGLVQQAWRESTWKQNDKAELHIPVEAIHLFDRESGARITTQ